VRRRTVLLALPVVAFLLVLSGCTTIPIAEDSSTATGTTSNARVETDLSNFTIPQPTPTPPAEVLAIVTTSNGRRANVRSGPGLDFPAVSAADPGTEFQVVGKNEEGDWWQICCINGDGDAEDEASTLAWLSEIVVTIDGDGDAVPVVQAVFPTDISAEWAVDWRCGSERCTIAECTATVNAVVEDVINRQWLQIDHTVLWDETCFSTDEWLFEVNRFTGQERTGGEDDSFLYRYWVGPQPGEVNGVFTLEDGRKVAAWCSGPHEVEVEVEDGWTTVYTGNTCHDVRTGILLSLTYEKQWLYTGEFEGTTYEQEYFGDFELLDQHLITTTAELAFVEENGEEN
jgi:hypothetical protein